MKHNIIITYICCVAVLVLGIFYKYTFAEEDTVNENNPSIIIFLNQNFRPEYYDEYNLEKKRYSDLPDDEVNLGIHSKLSHVALQCKWQNVAREITKDNMGKKRRIKNKVIMSSFCGFVESEINCTPPKWFKELLLRCFCVFTYPDESGMDNITDYVFIFPFGELPGKPSLLVNSSVGYWTSETGAINSAIAFDWEANYENKMLNLTVYIPNNKALTIPLSESEYWMAGQSFAPSIMSMTETSSHYVLSIANAMQDNYPIICVNKSDSNVAWRQTSWGSCMIYGGSSGGIPGVAVELVESGENIVLFGASSMTVFIEVYNKITGVCTLRFCPNLDIYSQAK